MKHDRLRKILNVLHGLFTVLVIPVAIVINALWIALGVREIGWVAWLQKLELNGAYPLNSWPVVLISLVASIIYAFMWPSYLRDFLRNRSINPNQDRES